MIFVLKVWYSVLNVPLLYSSLTRAQTYFSPWPLETGTSPASWPTIIKGTSCKTCWCFFNSQCCKIMAILLLDGNVWMFSRYFLSTEDDPKRRHLYRLDFPTSYTSVFSASAIHYTMMLTQCHPTVLTPSLRSTAAACLVSSSAAMWKFHSAPTCSTSYLTVKVSVLDLESLVKAVFRTADWERFISLHSWEWKSLGGGRKPRSVESTTQLVLHVRLRAYIELDISR